MVSLLLFRLYSYSIISVSQHASNFLCVLYFIYQHYLPPSTQDIADGSMNMMMNIYRDLLPSLGGYLTDKNRIHRARLELFVQELARREPLYFEHRAIEDQTSEYAGPQYRDFYYEVFFMHANAVSLVACSCCIF
jgi:5'-3' exonuclease